MSIQQAAVSLQQSPELGLEFGKKLVELAFRVVPQILWAIGIMLLTRVAITIVGRFTRKALNRTEPTLRKFLIQTAEILTLAIGIVAFLNTLGIEATSVVAVIGAAGLAIGLALQNTLSHFAAGVMLISLRPFDVGDFIEGGGVSGEVDAIGIFSTTLVTPDNVKITVPNGNLFTGTVKNTTAMGTRRVDLEIDIGDRPIELTIALLLSAVQPHPLVLNNPKPTCHVASISAKGTILYLRPWCAARVYEQVRSDVQKLVKEALDNNPLTNVNSIDRINDSL
ncbi:mechanosensitive ion channel family protein [Argonema antarcticum]|nr:mechanosensitive ion channel family protein [Argonema antarcticum]MCL1475460.1 mechanosensitive ion channel family protein [Argonema antarcticum A004/B2]